MEALICSGNWKSLAEVPVYGANDTLEKRTLFHDSSSFVVKQLKGKNQYKAMENTWKANANDATKASSIAMANRLRDYSDNRTAFIDRTHLVYDKGAYVLAMLHKEIGDDIFLSFLRNFQARYAWKYATTQDMVTLLQQLTKKDFTTFFEQNFWGTGMPQG